MSATLKDIADQAGVSIATVSHVINQTRFVSPDLVQRVLSAIENSDYREKLQKKSKTLRIGKCSEVAFIAPHLLSPVYAQLASSLSARLGMPAIPYPYTKPGMTASVRSIFCASWQPTSASLALS